MINNFIDWFNLDIEKCPCHGSGWAELDNNVWRKCSCHYTGQLRPDLLMDDLEVIFEDEEIETLKLRINDMEDFIDSLKGLLRRSEDKLYDLKLELINKTPTVKVEIVELIEDK